MYRRILGYNWSNQKVQKVENMSKPTQIHHTKSLMSGWTCLAQMTLTIYISTISSENTIIALLWEQIKWDVYSQDGTHDKGDGRQRISGRAHTWPHWGHIAPLVSRIVNHNIFRATTSLKTMWSIIIEVNNHFDTNICVVYGYLSHQLCQLCWIQINMYYTCVK